ncbi:MAG: amidohydrolase family protein, partial [Mycetocola sp.]
MGMPIIREWEALGGRPALGISVVTAASGDQFGTMRLALQSMRALDHEEEMARTGSWPQSVRLQARDAVRWATANGAHTIGMENDIGSLTVGKKGDVIVIKPGPFSLPMINPWSTVVVQSTRHDVTDVVVDGRVVKRDGVLATDLERLKEQLMASHYRVFDKVNAAGGLDVAVDLPS